MDDFIDDFDGSDFMDDDSHEDCPDGDFEHEESSDDVEQTDTTGVDTIDIGWREIAMFGFLSEEIAEEEKERLRIEYEMKKKDDRENDF